jgi:DNA repair protein RadA/Sms
VRLTEPASDLAVALAVASAAADRPLPAELVVVGEVGLAGEVRPVQCVERRLAEAARLGFTHALAPTHSGVAPADMQVTEVDDLRHAIAAAFRHAVIPLRRPSSN